MLYWQLNWEKKKNRWEIFSVNSDFLKVTVGSGTNVVKIKNDAQLCNYTTHQIEDAGIEVAIDDTIH